MKNVLSLINATVLLSIASLPLLLPAKAQITDQEFQMGRAREACVDQAQQQQLTFNGVVTTIPIANRSGQMIGSDVIMSVSRSGRVYEVRCSYDNASRIATISDLPSLPPGTPPTIPVAPAEGIFPGRGLANGSVFGDERSVDASLSFNQANNFAFSLAVPPGTGVQVQYTGTIDRIQAGSFGGPNNFILQGRVDNFASSADNLQLTNVTGNCTIEVFDALVISSSCNTQLRNSNTQFQGLIQF